MSRLDYVTIAIVAVCVAALVYLIYMTTNLLGDSGEPDTAAETTPPAGSEDQQDDTYYFDDQGRIEGDEQDAAQQETPATGSDASSNYDYKRGEDLDKGRSSAGGPATTSPQEMDTRGSGIAEEDYSSTSSGSSSTAGSGQYMVIAGTFSVSANAQEMENKLRGMGYNNVTLEPFDRGKYTVVLVGRFASLSDAKTLAGELEGKGVPAYVKRK
ncbi:MAG: SPOR domain-containing protein [Phaeodactylibacter sp.]|nr:SPOR domain-containing protein [Phaeodactylibacter sp.]